MIQAASSCPFPLYSVLLRYEQSFGQPGSTAL